MDAAKQQAYNLVAGKILTLLTDTPTMDPATITGILNPTEGANFIFIAITGPDQVSLLHNLEIITPGLLSSKPSIRDLHGFGKQTTPVILDFNQTIAIQSTPSVSLTNIKKTTKTSDLSVQFRQGRHLVPRRSPGLHLADTDSIIFRNQKIETRTASGHTGKPGSP
jgi:hypothetical protein